MIKTSRQLKDLVRNKTGGDSFRAQVMIRNYMMERLLERISMSSYKNKFVLKGGMLITSLIGNDMRSTMDMDTTIKNMRLSMETAEAAMKEIIDISLDDNVEFRIKSIQKIMDDAEYAGIRIAIEATLDNMAIPLKIDLSTGDAITPSEIEYQYRLMFEIRSIPVQAYSLETVFAEKMETIISRSVNNTRLRDFYDLYVLQQNYSLDMTQFKRALAFTSIGRNTYDKVKKGRDVLEKVASDAEMKKLWEQYQSKYDYAKNISWDDVMNSITYLYDEQKHIIIDNPLTPRGPKL